MPGFTIPMMREAVERLGKRLVGEPRLQLLGEPQPVTHNDEHEVRIDVEPVRAGLALARFAEPRRLHLDRGAPEMKVAALLDAKAEERIGRVDARAPTVAVRVGDLNTDEAVSVLPFGLRYAGLSEPLDTRMPEPEPTWTGRPTSPRKLGRRGMAGPEREG